MAKRPRRIFSELRTMPPRLRLPNVHPDILRAHLVPQLSARDMASLRAAFKNGNPVNAGAVRDRLRSQIEARQSVLQRDMTRFFEYVAAATAVRRGNRTVHIAANQEPFQALNVYDAIAANVRRLGPRAGIQVEFDVHDMLQNNSITFIPGANAARRANLVEFLHGEVDAYTTITFRTKARGVPIEYVISGSEGESAQLALSINFDSHLRLMYSNEEAARFELLFFAREWGPWGQASKDTWRSRAMELLAVARAYHGARRALGAPAWLPAMRTLTWQTLANTSASRAARKDFKNAARALAHDVQMDEGFVRL